MSFDRLARHYRWMEWLLAGEKLQRCRTAFLTVIPSPGNILLLGEGNGRFLTVCRERFPNAQITCVDASSRMLDQARRRTKLAGLNHDAITFAHADILSWKPSAADSYDLVVTNFFLDCFPASQLETIISKVGCLASNKASWLVADFQVASKGPE